MLTGGDVATLTAAINASLPRGTPAEWTGGTLTVSKTIDIKIGANTNGGGLVGPLLINSTISDGSPVMRFHVDDANVNVTNFLLEKITIIGSGHDKGLVISVPTNSSWMYRSCWRDINVLNCGGDGITFDGSIFESSLFNVWANDNLGNGVVFQHNGGQVSAISWHGGGARKNAKAGVAMLNGARDIKMSGLYFCENKGLGVNADQGCTGLWGCGFENNVPSGLRFQNFVNLQSCTFSTDGRQNPAISGYLSGKASFIATVNEDYGTGLSKFAQIGGNGGVTLLNSNKDVVVQGAGVTVLNLTP